MTMKRSGTGLALSALLALQGPHLFAQAKPAPRSGAPAVAMPTTDRMPMAEFKRLLAAKDVVVLDVRSADSYVAGHIPGALSLPEDAITPAMAEKLKRMGKPIATYCS
jgi:3-mercaptopyruvate sulfurtransferase SseA